MTTPHFLPFPPGDRQPVLRLGPIHCETAAPASQLADDRMPLSRLEPDFVSENLKLRARISALEAAVRQLQQKVMNTEEPPPALVRADTLSPEVVTLALGLLCGVFESQGLIFQNSLIHLLIVTATPFTHLPTATSGTTYAALSTALQLLLSHYDGQSRLDTVVRQDHIGASYTLIPPDILWLFVHTADHTLLLTFREVLRRDIAIFAGTRRGLTCEVLYGALGADSMGVGSLSKEDKVQYRVAAQMSSWRLGSEGLQRVSPVALEEVLWPYRQSEKKRRPERERAGGAEGRKHRKRRRAKGM